VLSLNLHCFKLEGTSFASNEERFAAIAALVAEEGVGALLLQEVCRRPGEDALELLQAAVEEATGEAWSDAWSFAHVGWEGTPDEADEGLGILARGPLGGAETLAGVETLEHAVQAGLRRVAISATLPGQGSGLRAMSVHFDVFDAAARRMQAREAAVAALVGSDPGFAAIVAGDFNDVAGSPAHAALSAMGFLDASAGLDTTKGIDHVFVHRAAPIRPAAAELVFIGADAVSDHPGVLVRFTKAAGDAVTATRVEGSADVGAGHFVSIRGSAAPLGWDIGWPMRAGAPGAWRFVTTELAGSFAFKLLRDDTAWQTGADVPGTAGQEHQVTPAF
jgi:endonuclease/exonuclease/phosphatase family metal-dependent hydrolase